MHRILDPESLGGLGLRRCQWYTTTLNEASQRASLRLGYTYEGTQRAAKVLPLGKEGIRRESARNGGRGFASLAPCFVPLDS
jgi:RimJ/RimL family protein N-acetyltransferase